MCIRDRFEVVIQLGAILAVVILFWNQIFPFGAPEGSHTVRRRQAKHAHKMCIRDRSIPLSIRPDSLQDFSVESVTDYSLPHRVSLFTAFHSLKRLA